MVQRGEKNLIAQKQLQRIQTETCENMKCQKFQTWLSGGRMKESRLPFMYNFKWPSLCGVGCWQRGGLDRQWSLPEGVLEAQNLLDVTNITGKAAVTQSSGVHQQKEKGGRERVWLWPQRWPPSSAATNGCGGHMQIIDPLISAAHTKHRASVSIEMYLPLRGSLCPNTKLYLFF